MTQSNLNVLTDRGSRSSKGDGEANTAEAGRRSIGDSVFNLNIGDDPESPPGRGSRRSSRLSGVQKEKLAHKLHDKLKAKPTEELDVGNHNSHADTNMSILTAFISGIINYLLMFGLCAAYGLIMFADDHNGRHIPLGVKMNLGSAMISGLLVSCFSKIRVAIGGPDLNPVVLLGSFVDSMQVSIADQLGLQLPTGGRRLASSGGGGQTFCYGAHLASYPTECETFHAQLRATTIFATAVSSLVFVILFLMFGRFRLTRYVTYIPTSILEAFLSCVGYKVFLYALKFCKYDPFQFVPAACIGVPLYFMKAYHVGHPGIVMPLGFLLPLGAFYVVVYGIMGSDVDTARKDKLMFPLMDNVDFWSVWTDSVGKAEYINFKAWLTTLPDLAIMMILVLLDCMLKIIGTESKLHMKVDKDYEVTLHGLSNILTTLTGSSVGYMQLKFNVINAGVMRNVQDRRGAMFYAIFCGACYFGTIAPINYMPRFFVGSLLFFAGSGFVCENLWGSRRYLHTIEWVEVVLILAVFIITGQLLVAVITGVCICGISFIVKYAKVPTIEGKPMRGADLKIVERRGPLILRNIRHVTESWLLVVRLKGFVFFASAQSLTAHVLGIIESEAKQKVPRYRRLRFVVFDCKGLDGVDASASKALASFVRDAREHKVRVIWSGLSKHFKEQFSRGGILGHAKDVLGDLDEAVMSVEDMALRYLQNIESRWIALHQSFADNHRLTKEHYHFEPFVQIFMSTTGRIGCPWQYCSKMRMEGHDTVLWSPGEQTGMLYLVHSGAVGLFKTLPKDDEHWGSPVAVYRHGWFLNRETIMRMPSKFYGVALEDGELLCWTQEQWWGMATERPLMMAEILKGVMKQQARDCDTIEMYHEIDAQDSELGDEGDHAWDDVFLPRELSVASFSREVSSDSIEAKYLKSQARIVGDEMMDLPELLVIRLRQLESADCLCRLNFYKDPPEGETAWLPALPGFLRNDLEIAFYTYASDSLIPSSVVSKALMFAGVFDYSQSFQVDSEKPTYTQDEFMDIGHKALMAPLCERDLRTIETFFKKADEDEDGLLNRHELMCFLQYTLSKHVNLEEVDGIALAWGEGNFRVHVSFDMETLPAVMSLFIRKHEHYWHMLQGFLDILGTDCIKETDQLNVMDLLKCGEADLTRQEAEEMLWAANWRVGPAGDPGMLPWTEFVSAIIVCVHRPHGPLPPAPRLRGTFFAPRTTERNVRQAQADSEEILPSTDHSFWLGCFQREEEAEATFYAPAEQQKERPALDIDLCSAADGEGEPSSPKSPGPSMPSTPSSPKSISGKLKSILEDPESSRLGRFMRRFGYFVIVASVLETILEPFIAGSREEQSETEKELWFDLECSVTGIFTLEILLRMIVATNGPVKWLRKMNAVCLLLATAPLYLELLLGIMIDKTAVAYRAVNLLRLARLARLSWLAHNHALLEAIVVSLVVVWGIYKKHELDEPA